MKIETARAHSTTSNSSKQATAAAAAVQKLTEEGKENE